MVQLDHKDLRVSLVQSALPDRKGLRVLQDPLVQLDRRGLKASLALRVFRVLLV